MGVGMEECRSRAMIHRLLLRWTDTVLVQSERVPRDDLCSACCTGAFTSGASFFAEEVTPHNRARDL